MKKSEMIMKKLWISGKKFVKSDEIKAISKEFKINYESILRYLLARRYLIRIFKGIFYVKSPEEIKLEIMYENPFNLVAKGLFIKGIKRWYFGLYTALVMNNITHEYFTVNYVINDSIFRANEIKIAGYSFKFIKVKPSLIFGIKEKENLRYSDLEKTILDFVYLWRYRSVPKERILVNISDLVEKASKSKLLEYSKRYPLTIRRIIDELL
ncbi:MAG: hypothetical protein QXU71_02295 [Candidatus Aenigmatarchaeota archaeon]